MNRYRGWIAISLLVLLGVVAVAAYGRPSVAASLDQRTRAVALGLRCLVCQGESVADSPATLSRDMRGVIRRKLQEGWSESRITSYFVAKYGNRILLSPPGGGLGDIAWLAPPLLVLGGLALLLTLLLDWRGRGRDDAGDGGGRYLDRVRAELAAEWSGE